MRLIMLLLPFVLMSCGGSGGSGGGLSPVPAKNSSEKVGDMPVAYANPGIFKTYRAGGDSVMNTTWTRKFDASGISFNDKRTCTLVTRQHVVMAAHYKRPVLSKVVFHDRNGKQVSRVLVAVRNVTGDCAVGLLNDPVPKGYKVYPLLKPEPILGEKLKGEFVLVTDQNKRLFVHEVGNVSKRANGYSNIALRYDAAKQIGYGKILVTGDSGNPSFVMVKGEPVLIEAHHTGGAGAGPFYGDVDVQEKLKAAIQALGGSGSIRTVAWR